jgi:hypothetical protein
MPIPPENSEMTFLAVAIMNPSDAMVSEGFDTGKSQPLPRWLKANRLPEGSLFGAKRIYTPEPSRAGHWVKTRPSAAEYSDHASLMDFPQSPISKGLTSF